MGASVVQYTTWVTKSDTASKQTSHKVANVRTAPPEGATRGRATSTMQVVGLNPTLRSAPAIALASRVCRGSWC